MYVWLLNELLFYRFSCDEGLSWNTYDIFGDPGDPERVRIYGMFTELGEKVVHAT